MSSTSGYSTSREPGPAQPVGGGGGEVLLEKDLARLRGEGDVSVAIEAADPAGRVDLVLGIGGTPEGV
ncbi:fructose-bisphosphatase class II, partial [Rathayibacter rathayi]|uniref:fructose-bisphosphatase class II n=1 Tax=Rathayibacter rathayi TaxID=33887 RepID=UPI0011B054B3